MPDEKKAPAQEEQSFQLKLPKDLHRKLKIRSAETGRTMTDLIIEALRQMDGLKVAL